MAMLPGLQLNVSQQLKLTPQLQQSIKILQLSAIELQQAIEEALDSNIMLERDQDEYTEDTPTDNHLSLNDADTDATNNTDDDWSNASLAQLQLENSSPDIDHSGELTNTLDCQWDDIYDTDRTDVPDHDTTEFTITQHRDDDEFIAAENYTAAHEDLYDHLQWQVDTFTFEQTNDNLIAHYLIDAINEQGYLNTSLESILADIEHNDAITPTLEDMERILRTIQDNFEPAGVGARNIQECLIIQLHAMIPQTPLIHTTVRMLTERFDWFAHGDFVRLKRIYGLGDGEWHRAMQLIQSCNPKPGLRFANSEREVIIPDLIVKRDNKGWKIELNSHAYPRVKINSEYVDLLKKIDKQQNEQIEQMKTNLIDAKGLLKSIQSRGETLLKVATYLITEQVNFLEKGEVAMRPMVLRDVADALGLHESTISRATTQKYIQTPRGTYELKYFFSSSVSQYGPQDQSAVSIKARIKQLIDAEDAKKPISDQDLVDKLEEMNISVARRTIAKYREALNIPSSSQRRRR